MARTKKEIQSFKRVMDNLNREIKEIKGKTMRGLINASIIVRRDMDKTAPLIPIDTGNLRGSWFWTRAGTKDKPTLIIGFSANYAVFVHEMVGANFKRPGSGAKFFEAALNRNQKEILEAIRKETKV